MAPPLDPDPHTRRLMELAHGGHASGVVPLPPGGRLARTWVVGDPAHWQERSAFSYRRALLLRLMALLQLAASFAYLQYRFRFTIGVFKKSQQTLWYALQMTFFVYELIVALFPLCHALEVWNVVQRNCVDFKRLPNDRIKPEFRRHQPDYVPDHDYERDALPCYANYPTVAVVIPCYKEDTDMVLQVVQSAAKLDYPRHLLSVYLCDDGRDPRKQAGVERLRATGTYHTDSLDHCPSSGQPTQTSHTRRHTTDATGTETTTTEGGHESRRRQSSVMTSWTTSSSSRGFPNVFYVTRPDNKNAKPGNVNYTLSRTNSDLVVQLDADFVARPYLVQRLLPYYFVWNEQTGLYEFNRTLAYVQTPQHYRNMSAYDHDFFDQRNIIFFSHILPGKDWFNCASMVGTSNLINRVALDDAGNFPYHSKGDDTALSVIFHGMGYRSYYVNESVATGLAPPSLKGNLSQRNRWYKSDFEILFSKWGPLTIRGLSLIQRIMYLAVPMFRLLNILMFTFDVLLILVLIAGFLIVDVQYPRTFIVYLCIHLAMPVLYKVVECVGTPGVFKSVAANEVFEAVFRYSTLKGFVQALLHDNKAWKIAEKTGTTTGTTNTQNPMTADNNNNDNTAATSSSEATTPGKTAGNRTDGTAYESESDESGFESDVDHTTDNRHESRSGHEQGVDNLPSNSHNDQEEGNADPQSCAIDMARIPDVEEEEGLGPGEAGAASSTVRVPSSLEITVSPTEETTEAVDGATGARTGQRGGHTDSEMTRSSGTKSSAGTLSLEAAKAKASSVDAMSSSSEEKAKAAGEWRAGGEGAGVEGKGEGIWKGVGRRLFDGPSYGAFVRRNLKRCWYNVVMAVVFVGSIVYCAIRPPDLSRRSDTFYNEEVQQTGYFVYNNTLPLALAFGYAISNVTPHILALGLCFRRRYLTGWQLADLVHGRCDEWAVRTKVGDGTDGAAGKEVFVPRSYVTLISVARSILIFGGVVYTAVFSIKDDGRFVPLNSASAPP